MQVDCIQEYTRLQALKDDWEAVYYADSNATVFSSFDWIGAWLKTQRHPWYVLAVRENGRQRYDGFLVLGYDRPRLRLYMGGNNMADHTAYLSRPETEKEALEEFAAFIRKNFRWKTLEMRDLFDKRIDRFASNFNPGGYVVHKEKDNICPFIQLPDDWELFLSNYVRPKLQKIIHKSFKKIETMPSFRLQFGDNRNIDEQIETVLTLWQKRWKPVPADRLTQYREIFRMCHQNNRLWSAVAYDADKPIAGILCFVDAGKRYFSYYISGYDADYSIYSPGTVILSISIQYAINSGYAVYDLLRGAEKYKYGFGAIDRSNEKLIIKRNDWKSKFWRLSDMAGRKKSNAADKIQKIVLRIRDN